MGGVGLMGGGVRWAACDESTSDPTHTHTTPPQIASFRVSEAEVARGLCHLCEAVQYVHYVRRRLHLGICPEAVFITPQVRLGCDFGCV